MQWIYQEEKVEHLEKYLTWFTPLVSSMAAIIFAAEEQIDKRGPGAGNLILFRVFYASNYYEVFCKLNVVDFEEKNKDGLNWKLPIGFLLSGCFMSPLKRSQDLNSKADLQYLARSLLRVFLAQTKCWTHTGVHSQIEFTLRRATEAELLWFGELRQVYKPENNPIGLFWVLRGFSLRFFCVFYFAKNKPWYNLLIFSFFACNTNQFVIWCSDQWPV